MARTGGIQRHRSGLSGIWPRGSNGKGCSASTTREFSIARFVLLQRLRQGPVGGGRLLQHPVQHRDHQAGDVGQGRLPALPLSLLSPPPLPRADFPAGSRPFRLVPHRRVERVLDRPRDRATRRVRPDSPCDDATPVQQRDRRDVVAIQRIGIRNMRGIECACVTASEGQRRLPSVWAEG